MQTELLRYVEYELRAYNETLQALDESKMMTCRRARYAEKTCIAIANVFDSLPVDLKEYVRQRFWEKPGRQSNRDMDRDILQAIAQEMGALKIEGSSRPNFRQSNVVKYIPCGHSARY